MAALPLGPSARWTVQAVGDFNGDGKADILWRHSLGLLDLWLMNGPSVVGQGPLGAAGPEWAIQGIGDFNGDAKADILWRHSSGRSNLAHQWHARHGCVPTRTRRP